MTLVIWLSLERIRALICSTDTAMWTTVWKRCIRKYRRLLQNWLRKLVSRHSFICLHLVLVKTQRPFTEERSIVGTWLWEKYSPKRYGKFYYQIYWIIIYEPFYCLMILMFRLLLSQPQYLVRKIAFSIGLQCLLSTCDSIHWLTMETHCYSPCTSMTSPEQLWKSYG